VIVLRPVTAEELPDYLAQAGRAFWSEPDGRRGPGGCAVRRGPNAVVPVPLLTIR
jgi:hypothetical protein